MREVRSLSRRRTRAAATQPWTSAETTSTVRSARWSTSSAAPSGYRGTSHTTVRPALLPASTTAARATSVGPGPVRPHDRTDNRPRPRRRVGKAASSSLIATRPAGIRRSGQRRPSSASVPSTRSIPPPRGSQSTSSTASPERAAVTATLAANTDAPAPPRPPTTARTLPSRALGRSTTSASEVTTSSSSAGRMATPSTPNDTAAFHSACVGASVRTRSTFERRGNPPTSGTRSSSTSGASVHRARTAEISRAWSGSHPTAAASRTTCSRTVSSETTTSGRLSVISAPSVDGCEHHRHAGPRPKTTSLTDAVDNYRAVDNLVDNRREAAPARGRSEGRRRSVPGGRTELTPDSCRVLPL